MSEAHKPNWSVLLLGGPSGVGKSSVSYPLARHFNVGISEIDAASEVRALFLYEPDETQILRNFAMREPGGGEQAKRARVSLLFGRWLKDECGRFGVVALPARPWDTLLPRILEAIS